MIDSQSVRAADTVPKASRGWDNAKKVNGRKRHIAVDTAGLLLAIVVTAACVQDRDAARPLLWNLRRASRRPPGLGRRRLRRQAGHLGHRPACRSPWRSSANATPHPSRSCPAAGSSNAPFAWISTHRRCARDYERLPASHEAMVLWAMIALMTQRLAHTQ